MHRNGFFTWIAVLGLLAAACSETHETVDSGPPPPPDGGMMDTSLPPPDTSPPPPTDGIGAPCTGPMDCASGVCADESQGFPEGYCTQACTPGGAACPDGSTCVPVGRGTAVCLDDCDVGAGRACRPGYGCLVAPALPNGVCLSGCLDDTDCPMGTMCDPDGGIGAGACYDPTAGYGDACTEASMCPESSICLTEEDSGWPGGGCVGVGCDVAGNTGCLGDGQCLETDGGDSVCIDGCTTDADCRDGFGCRPSNAFPERMICDARCDDDSQCSDGRVCNPVFGLCTEPFDPAELGQPCSAMMSACEGGFCLREFTTGFPGSYCVAVGCDPDAADPGCPGDGVCIEGAGGTGVCLDGCVDLADCPRDGYDCLPSDRADPTSALVCSPACTTDDSCANMGFTCNDGTGLCTEPFDSARLGDPCTSRMECPGGRCVTEEAAGWPGGTCAYPGCRLSGTGPAEVCPLGSVCVDDEQGDPEIGACLTECTVGMTGDCRVGYACNDEGGGVGACRPACTDDAQCSGGRTCDVPTGLCTDPAA